MRLTVICHAVLLLAVFSLVSPICAQPLGCVDGDCVVYVRHPPVGALFWFTAGGIPLMSAPSPGGSAFPALTAAPGNDGIIYFVGGARPTIAKFDRVAVMSTLRSLASTLFRDVPTILVDQSGDLLLLNESSTAADGGIYRVPRAGAGFTTVVNGIPDAVTMEEDLATGDFLVADRNGTVHRVTRNGTVSSVIPAVFPASYYPDTPNLHTCIHDGQILAAWGGTLYKLDPRTGRTTSLVSSGSCRFIGIDHDPVNGGYYRAETNGSLSRYDPRTGHTTPLASLWGYWVHEVATWGSRILTGAGPARPGVPYGIDVSLPSEAARVYVAGAAFGTTIGIATPAGRVPLDRDALFFLSQADPYLFSGFSGVLGPAGTARLTVNLPNIRALKGLRFFVAVVILGSNGIRRISEPLGVTIE